MIPSGTIFVFIGFELNQGLYAGFLLTYKVLFFVRSYKKSYKVIFFLAVPIKCHIFLAVPIESYTFLAVPIKRHTFSNYMLEKILKLKKIWLAH